VTTEREEVVNEILRRYGLPTFEWQDLAEEILKLIEEELAHARNEAYDEARKPFEAVADVLEGVGKLHWMTFSAVLGPPGYCNECLNDWPCETAKLLGKTEAG
jgi:hypothetical protein